MAHIALVTGGSRGIGAATVKELSSLGYTVAVNYLENKKAAQDVCEMIMHCGGYARAYQADISTPESIERMFSQIERDLGEVEILVNNAGVSHIGLLQDMSYDEILMHTKVNLLGAIYCTKRAIPGMIRNKAGSIINLSSMWGEVGASCEVAYSACKAGIIGFTKALAKELGPSGIRVNCVSPGVIRTDMNSELTEDVLNQLGEETPLLRLGTTEEVGRTIAFLATEDASFITGQVISVNGGII